MLIISYHLLNQTSHLLIAAKGTVNTPLFLRPISEHNNEGYIFCHCDGYLFFGVESDFTG